MGNVCFSVVETLKARCCITKPDYKVTLFGPGTSGKTTILYRLKTNQVVDSMLTCSGFNVESILTKRMYLTVWDVAGSCDSPCTWKYYFPDSRALIFVVDSEDRHYMHLAKENLSKALVSNQFQDLKDPILLIWANKQDSPHAMTIDEIAAKLELDLMFWVNPKKITWHIQGCSATTGEGLKEGIDWLTDQIRRPRRKRHSDHFTAIEVPVV